MQRRRRQRRNNKSNMFSGPDGLKPGVPRDPKSGGAKVLRSSGPKASKSCFSKSGGSRAPESGGPKFVGPGGPSLVITDTEVASHGDGQGGLLSLPHLRHKGRLMSLLQQLLLTPLPGSLSSSGSICSPLVLNHVVVSISISFPEAPHQLALLRSAEVPRHRVPHLSCLLHSLGHGGLPLRRHPRGLSLCRTLQGLQLCLDGPQLHLFHLGPLLCFGLSHHRSPWSSVSHVLCPSPRDFGASRDTSRRRVLSRLHQASASPSAQSPFTPSSLSLEFNHSKKL